MTAKPDKKHLLAQLNELRIAEGKPPLKAWKGSFADLEKTVELSTPKEPKTRRKPQGTVTVAEWCSQNGYNPKVARAKLRKSGLKKEGPWILTPEVKSILPG